MTQTTITALSVAFLLGACAPIQHYQTLQQPTNEVLQTHIGGPIVQINLSKDLPNAFGAADIYGGKTSEGQISVFYKGMSQNGNPKLQINDQRIESNETTMTRYGFGQTTGIATQSGNTTYVYGTTTQPQANTNVYAPGVTEFEFDMSEAKTLTITNVEIEFVEVNPYNLKYRLRETTVSAGQ